MGALPLEGLLHDPPLVVEMREEISALLQSQLRSVHLRLLNGVAVSLGQSVTPEVDRDGVDSGVGWSLTLNDLVDRDVGLPAVHRPESETALLQLGLRVVPVLVEDKLLEARE